MSKFNPDRISEVFESGAPYLIACVHKSVELAMMRSARFRTSLVDQAASFERLGKT